MTTERQIGPLLQQFGYSQLLPGQQQVMTHLLDGHSAAAVFPTGGGKSLCYQLPSLAFDGVTLVVSPLIALMKDQIDQLTGRGVAASRLDSSLSADEHREVMEGVRQGRVKLLYVAPERFNNERFRAAIAGMRISMLAIDEAHCISEWGHNFRPDYLKLAEFAKQCRAERILALTATATPQVLDDICRAFEIQPQCAVRTTFHRANLTLQVSAVTPASRDLRLLELLKQREPGPAIVYVTLQKTAERVAQQLAQAGLSAQAYHAGLGPDQRNRVQDWFMASGDAIVVATIAFGMGVDKSNIRYVYHYNLPKSLENYSQEIGRAGRDGETSVCEVLATLDDLRTLENFAYGDTPDAQDVGRLVDHLLDGDRDFDVSLTDLSYQFDMRPVVVRTLLTYLELDGVLEGGTPFYSSYQFQPLHSSDTILSKFAGERREFLAQLFKQARQAKTWFHLDVEQAAQRLRTSRDRIVRALDYLGEQQLLQVRVAGVRHRYRLLQAPQDRAALVDELARRMLDREQMEIGRLAEVVELLTLDGCQTSRLCEHFGELLEQPCGHCAHCLEGAVLELPRGEPPQVAAATWSEARALCAEHPEALGSPRAVARLLCGISSPRASRARLGRHRLFGVCENLPFADVLARIERDAAQSTMG